MLVKSECLAGQSFQTVAVYGASAFAADRNPESTNIQIVGGSVEANQAVSDKAFMIKHGLEIAFPDNPLIFSEK